MCIYILKLIYLILFLCFFFVPPSTLFVSLLDSLLDVDDDDTPATAPAPNKNPKNDPIAVIGSIINVFVPEKIDENM